jgi:hypothetical protein
MVSEEGEAKERRERAGGREKVVKGKRETLAKSLIRFRIDIRKCSSKPLFFTFLKPLAF